MEMPLTGQQIKFCQEYIVDRNLTQAALRAGYAKVSASVQGARLIKKDKIKNLIMELDADRRESAKKRHIDADWLLNRLAAEMDADLADIYTPEGAFKPVHQWPLIWRQGLVSSIEYDEYGNIIKVKLPADRTAKRIELIGKHVDVQAFNERATLEVVDKSEIIALARARARERTIEGTATRIDTTDEPTTIGPGEPGTAVN